MRHGEAFRPGMEPELRAAPWSALTKRGTNEARAVSGRLREQLGDDVVVWHAPTPEATETARALWPSRREALGSKSISELRAEATGPIVIVGHDPEVTRLLNELVRKKQFAAGPLPLGRGELAMLDGENRLRWVLCACGQDSDRRPPGQDPLEDGLGEASGHVPHGVARLRRPRGGHGQGSGVGAVGSGAVDCCCSRWRSSRSS